MSWQQLNINTKIFREESPVTQLYNYRLFYHEERYSRYSEKFTRIHQTTDRTLAQRVFRRTLRADVQVRFQATPGAIRGGRSDSLTGFRLSTSDILCHYDSTNAAHSNVVLLSPTLHYLKNGELRYRNPSLSHQITRRHIPERSSHKLILALTK